MDPKVEEAFGGTKGSGGGRPLGPILLGGVLGRAFTKTCRARCERLLLLDFRALLAGNSQIPWFRFPKGNGLPHRPQMEEPTPVAGKAPAAS